MVVTSKSVPTIGAVEPLERLFTDPLCIHGYLNHKDPEETWKEPSL